MKKTNRIFALILAGAVTTAMSLAGCGEAAVSSGTGTAGSTQTQSAAAGKKVLRVGMECAYAPYNWTQSNSANGAVPISNAAGSYTGGYDIKMAQKLCAATGYELQIVKTEWDGLVPGITSGKLDAIIAGMSATAKRKQTVDFTDNYYDAYIYALVKKDGKFKSAKTLKDLSGAKCTSQQSTIWYDEILPQVPGSKVQPALTDVPTCIVSLNSGKVDMIMTDKPTALAAVAANPGLQAVDLSKDSSLKVAQENINIGIAISKQKPELKAALNKALAAIPQSERDKMMDEAIKEQPLNS